MSLIINEEQNMLKSSAKEFLDLKSPISLMRELRDDNYNQFDSNFWKQIVEMGWTALTIPEEYNGLDFGYVGLGQVIEEMGRKLTISPMISTVLVSTSMISMSKNGVLKSKLFDEIMSGRKLCTLAHEENSHHSPNIDLSIISENNKKFILNSKKRFVIDGSVSDYLIVSANSESNGSLELIVIDSKSKGITFNNKVHMDSKIYSDITFNNVEFSKDNLLSTESDGQKILNKTLDIACVGLAAEMLGIIQQAFDMTMQYLKEREQFGVKIGSFQALQHRSAIMFGEIELCKSIVLKSLQAIDSNDKNLSELASLAKSKLGLTSKLVTNEAVQMHGGIGVTDDADIGFFLKRSRVIQRIFGDSNYHLDRVAKFNKY